MKHLYEQDGILHACDTGNVGLPNDHDTKLVWTKCEIDVPANQSFMSEEQVTCEKCKEGE